MSEINDPWSSVENMLRWQISLARKRVAEYLERLPKIGELYPLPKAGSGASPHGLPDHWAFGNLTNHQVNLSIVMRGLRWAEHEIEKAEAALLEGKLPDSINWIMSANQSINSSIARWSSGSSIAMWRYVGKYRKTQAGNAGSKRATISIGDERSSMTDLVSSLAAETDWLGDPIPVKELWNRLLELLYNRGADPKEEYDEEQCCPVVHFFSDYELTSYKFTSFKTTVSKLRSKKS